MPNILPLKSFTKLYAMNRGITIEKAKVEINCFLFTLKQVMFNNQGLVFRNFFSVTPVSKKSRSGKVNGCEYTIPEHKSIKFSVSKNFVEELNNNG